MTDRPPRVTEDNREGKQNAHPTTWQTEGQQSTMAFYSLDSPLLNNSSWQGHFLVSSSDWIKTSPAQGTLGITGSHSNQQTDSEAPSGKPARYGPCILAAPFIS